MMLLGNFISNTLLLFFYYTIFAVFALAYKSAVFLRNKEKNSNFIINNSAAEDFKKEF